MITPQLTTEQITAHGYVNPKVFDDGKVAAVYLRIYNTIIVADIHQTGYEEQW